MKILGIVLARNEDFFIRSAIRNILPACDEVLVFDHQSSDQTPEILADLGRQESRISVRRIRTPAESHRALEPYAGTDTWVFAVDGDEIYDPGRTRVFCDRLRSGECSDFFQLRGNVLHVDEWSGEVFHGFLAPPSRAMTKLFNFAHLKSWNGGFERLHGGEKVFQEGCEPPRQKVISDEFSFEDSPFRCLHLVFLRRSSLEKPGQGPRLNIADGVSARFGERCLRRVKKLLGMRVSSPGKLKNYRLGERVRIKDSVFRLEQEIWKSQEENR